MMMAGVGSEIEGLKDGQLWGEIVADEGKIWKLNNGRIAKKKTEGTKWKFRQAGGYSRPMMGMVRKSSSISSISTIHREPHTYEANYETWTSNQSAINIIEAMKQTDSHSPAFFADDSTPFCLIIHNHTKHIDKRDKTALKVASEVQSDLINNLPETTDAIEVELNLLTGESGHDLSRTLSDRINSNNIHKVVLHLQHSQSVGVLEKLVEVLPVSRIERLHLNGEFEVDTVKELFEVLYDSKVTWFDFESKSVGKNDLAFQWDCTRLKHLEIKCKRISDLTVKYIAKQLPAAKDLNFLLLRSNAFTDKALEYLVGEDDNRYLAKSQIQELRICSRAAESTDIGDQGVQILAAALPQCKIETLYIDLNNLTDSGVKHLANCLPISKIKHLYLNRNTKTTKIGTDSVSVLADVISNDRIGKLVSLGLRCHNINQASFEKLMQSLENNTNVTALAIRGITPDLKWDHNTFNGCRATITELNLGGNKLTLNAVEQIANLLKDSSVKDLNLWNCSIDDEGAKKLGDMLKSNKLLKVLELSGNNKISIVGKRHIFERLCDRFSHPSAESRHSSFPLETLGGCTLDDICSIDDNGIRKTAENSSILKILKSIVENKNNTEFKQLINDDAGDNTVKFVVTRFTLFDLENRQSILDKAVKQFPSGEIFNYLSDEFAKKSPKDADKIIKYMRGYDKRTGISHYINKIEALALKKKLMDAGKEQASKEISKTIHVFIITNIVITYLRTVSQNWETYSTWAETDEFPLNVLDLTVPFWCYLFVFRWIWNTKLLPYCEEEITKYKGHTNPKNIRRSFLNACLDPDVRMLDGLVHWFERKLGRCFCCQKSKTNKLKPGTDEGMYKRKVKLERQTSASGGDTSHPAFLSEKTGLISELKTGFDVIIFLVGGIFCSPIMVLPDDSWYTIVVCGLCNWWARIVLGLVQILNENTAVLETFYWQLPVWSLPIILGISVEYTYRYSQKKVSDETRKKTLVFAALCPILGYLFVYHLFFIVRFGFAGWALYDLTFSLLSSVMRMWIEDKTYKQEMKRFALEWWYWICISLFTLVVFLHKNGIVDTFGTVDACVQRFIITPFNNWVAKKEFEDVMINGKVYSLVLKN